MGSSMKVFIFPLLLLAIWPTPSQQQHESPEVVEKWRKFVQSLSSSQRSAFDRIHQDAGKLDSTELAKKVEQFKAQLDSDQKRSYEEIQHRGEETGGGNNRGGGDGRGDDRERQQKTQGQGSEPPSHKSGTSQGLDRWINSPELSESTKNSLRSIKEIFHRSEIDAVEKCERIEHILRAIGSADKKKMKIPIQLLNIDCKKEGQGGAENVLAAALTRE